MNKHDKQIANLKRKAEAAESIGIGRTLVGTGFAGASGVVSETVSPGLTAGVGGVLALLGSTKVLPKALRPVAIEAGKATWYGAVAVKSAKVAATIDFAAAKDKVANAVERLTSKASEALNGAPRNGAGKHVEVAPAVS